MKSSKRAEQHYVIILQKNNVAVYEYNIKSNQLNTIKNKGETSFEFDDGFWKWFFRKTEYKKEIPICFFVFTDKNVFNMPDNINLGLPEIQTTVIRNLLKERLKLKVNSFSCLVYPGKNSIIPPPQTKNLFQKKSKNISHNSKSKPAPQKKIKTDEPIKAYFRLKTEQYKKNK